MLCAISCGEVFLGNNAGSSFRLWLNDFSLTFRNKGDHIRLLRLKVQSRKTIALSLGHSYIEERVY
jgi:hypothetical protein